MIRILLAFTAVLAFTLSAVAKPYTVPNSEVLALRSKQTGAAYQVFVALPPDYRTSTKTYPVVYMLDADYSFALVRNVVQHFTEREDMPPVILVAIAYPGAAGDRTTYRMNRTRDYTPTYVPEGGYGAEFQKVSGGGPKFRAFIASELIPLIESRYRADRQDRTIIGHSYGGLFGTYILFTQPALFKRYIIVSPSLWYSKRVALTMEQTAAASGLRPDARVFFAVGSREAGPMVDNLLELIEKLKSRGNTKLKVRYQVFDGETHNSVFPGAVTRGLLAVFEEAN